MAPLSANQALLHLGVSGTTQKQYRADGVSEKVADRLAARAGLTTYEVWPEMIDHIIDDAMVDCARPDCPDRFLPNDRRHIYCSTTCKNRMAARRWTARSREGRRDELRAERRAYYETYGEYERARQRRHHERTYADRKDDINARRRARYAKAKSAKNAGNGRPIDGADGPSSTPDAPTCPPIPTGALVHREGQEVA
jgi:hypothetical protein